MVGKTRAITVSAWYCAAAMSLAIATGFAP
jgi:hypothetical protein